MQTSCTAKVCVGKHYGATSPLTTAYLTRAGRGTTEWLTFLLPAGDHNRGGGSRGVWIKRLLMLKVVVLLILAACLQASARGYSQGVTITAKDSPLKAVFQKITEQTGYPFLYNDQALEKTRPVTISVKNATLEQAMDQVLKGQPLTYSIVNKTIIVRPKTSKQSIDDEITGVDVVDTPIGVAITVRGRVVSENGEPVVGATVVVKGTNNATSTNDNGEFVLSGVAVDAMLVITGVNIQPHEVKVDGRTNLSISVQLSVTERETVRVINTGYQRISKERFVGSYQQLDSQDFHSRPGMGIIERLDGRVNSVFFNKKGSGSFLPSIIIRGVSTLGSAGASSSPTSFAPLIVIDNFPMPENFKIDNINPNDVESITVLTDAAAASIWGARAGNGVIVITTKQGKYNQHFQVDVSSNISIQEKPDLYFYDQITPSEFIDIEQYTFYKGAYDGLLGNTFNYPAVSPVIEILDQQRRGLLTKDQAENQINALRNVDLRQELNQHIYRNAVQQQHYLAVRGGTHNLAYQISGGYNRSLNSMQGSKPDEGYTLTTNTSFRPYRNLEIFAGINLAFGKTQSTSLPVLPNYPYARLLDDQGNALAIPNQLRLGYADTIGGGSLLDWHYRPLDEIRYADKLTNSRFIRLSAGLNYQLTSWLKAGMQYLFQNTFGNTRTFYGLQTYFVRDLINRYTNLNEPNSNPNLRYPVPLGGILDVTDNLAKNYNLRASLSVNKNFGINHQLNGLVAWEITDSKGGYLSTQRTYGYDPITGASRVNMDYLNPYTTYYAPSPFSNFLIPNFNHAEEGDINRFVSLLANAGYSYKNKYSVYASARRDGANLFGVATNNQWKPLWSAGGGWEISKENFYNVAQLPFLKLKASYGYTGNSNNSLSGVFTFTNVPSLDLVTGLPYAQPNYAPNNLLKWEEVVITNLGLDFGLFKSQRLTGSFEIYRKKANDVISLAPNPASTGVLSYVTNYANLRTNGYEIRLNSKNIAGAFNWNTDIGWSYAKTKVTELFIEGGYRIGDYLNYNLNAFPGQIIFGLSSYRWAGLDPFNGDPLGYYQGQITKNYNDIALDSIKNQVFHGSSLPLSTAFLRNSFSWKGFSVAFNLTGRFQYYFREPSLNVNSTQGLLTEGQVSTDYYRRWQKPGDEAFTNVPSIYFPMPSVVGGRSSFYQLSEIHVKRADNIRLQDASISYQWINKGIKNLPFQSINMFAYLNNINWIIWRTASSEWDPDFTDGALGGVPAPPPSKTWTVGATINF